MKTQTRETRQRRALFLQEETQGLLDEGDLSPAVIVDAHAPLSLNNQTPVQLEIQGHNSQAVSQTLLRKNGVLIFGSAQKPGGGWLNGAIAQEEDVSLLSTWGHQATKAAPGFYGTTDGMGEDNILVADSLWVMHLDEYLLNPFQPVSFISVAAPNRRAESVREKTEEALVDHLARRLRTAFDVWHERGISVVVGGAIGCGVFKWPPEQSAKAWLLALQSTPWRGQLILAMPDFGMAQAFEKVLAPIVQPPVVADR